MKDMIEYKGYYGSVHYSSEDDILYGKLEGIRGLINYEATTIKELKESFQEAVDDYLETCKELEKEPEKPFKGSFNVRIGPELHQKIAILAEKQEKSINKIICEALERYIA